jgi:hypothetical protein
MEGPSKQGNCKRDTNPSAPKAQHYDLANRSPENSEIIVGFAAQATQKLGQVFGMCVERIAVRDEREPRTQDLVCVDHLEGRSGAGIPAEF